MLMPSMKHFTATHLLRRCQKEVHLKLVVNSNQCFLHLHKHKNQLLITAVIDNLIKGASGQAIQNLNLMMGWEETLGLQLKSSIFKI